MMTRLLAALALVGCDTAGPDVAPTVFLLVVATVTLLVGVWRLR